MQEGRETAGFTIRLVLEYVRTRTGEDGVRRLLALAADTRPLEVLEDERVWSSYEQKLALFEAAALVCDDPDVARRIGQTALEAKVGATLKVLLSMFGSPAQLVGQIAKANAKFSTAGDMDALEVSGTSATVRYAVRPGYRLSRHDCGYAEGLLSQVPALFGLPPAEVSHDECQVLGAPACLFRLRWRVPTRVGRMVRNRRRARDFTPVAVHEHLHDLQSTVADLVSADDVDTVLARIAERARSAVAAQGFLLLTRLRPEQQPQIRSDGLTDAEAKEISESLLRDAVPIGVGRTLVAPVRSATRDYGWLVAVGEGRFLDAEEEMLQSYGRVAAAALEAATVRQEAHVRQHTAEVLLSLARSLLHADDVAAVTRLTAEHALSIVGADHAAAMLWDPDQGVLVPSGWAGWPDDLAGLLPHLRIDPEETPELGDLTREPALLRTYDADEAGPSLRRLLDAYRTSRIAVVPMHSDEGLLGILLAAWRQGRPLPPVDAQLLARMSGLADQASTATLKARLLEQVRHQARTDALTGLANRRVFTERLQAAIDADRPGTSAVLFLDLDRFKVVNDTYGHGTGDELLRAVAGRLLSCLRPEDTVARIGGDEFTVFLPRVNGEAGVRAAGERILTELSAGVEVAGRVVYPRPSIGGVLVHHGSVGDVLRDADAAMYLAKQAGGNHCVIADPDRTGVALDRLALEAELQTAVAQESFTLLYQPQVRLDTGGVDGVEAVVRWDHPERGRLTPDEFISLAHEAGLVGAIDLWALRAACRQAAAWRAHGLPLRVAVNLSARTLCDPTLAETIVAALAETNLPASLLEIEITEWAAMTETSRALDVLTWLRSLGVSAAIDDVGTGYSTLSWVQTFPLDCLKVDRSFVAAIVDGSGTPVVEMVVALASRLGCRVVAEGVQTEEEERALRALGCHEAQGFLYAPALEADALLDWAAARRRAATGGWAQDWPYRSG